MITSFGVCIAGALTSSQLFLGWLLPAVGVLNVMVVFIALLTADELAQLKAGQQALIHAATGGVGLVAVAYVQLVGATAFATAGRAEKHAHLQSAGVKHTASSRDCGLFEAEMGLMLSKQTRRAMLDALLNSLSHDEYIPASLALLRHGGHFEEIGKRGIWSEEEMATARPDVAYHTIAVDHRTAKDPSWMRAMLECCVRRAVSNDVTPLPVTPFEMRYEVGVDS